MNFICRVTYFIYNMDSSSSDDDVYLNAVDKLKGKI